MKQKHISILLVLVLTITLLTACGTTKNTPASETTATPAPSATTQKDQPKETATLRFWGGIPPEAGPARVVSSFNEVYRDKGIQVEYERFVNDDQGNLKLETSLMAGNEVDIYVNYATFRLQKRVDAGMAMDLSSLIERDKFDYAGLFGESVKSSYINGKPYTIATTLTKGSLLVNKNMFDEAGIEIPTEWTFDEFREVCKKLTKGEGQNKVYGMFWNTQQNITEYWLYLAQQTLGGDFIYKAGSKETNFDNPAIQKSAELVWNTMQDGTAPTHVDSVTQKLTQEGMFLSGRSAMTVGNWLIRNVKNVKEYPHDFVTAYAPYPVIAKDQRNYTYGTVGDHLAINPKSEHLDEAWEFVKWYSTGGMLPMASGGRIPLCSSIDSKAIGSEFVSGAEKLIDIDSASRMIFPAAGQKLTIQTITKSLPEIMAVLNEETEAYFTGKKDLNTAFTDAKKRADEFLK